MTIDGALNERAYGTGSAGALCLPGKTRTLMQPIATHTYPIGRLIGECANPQHFIAFLGVICGKYEIQ
ncbi:hypothetical protein J2W32_001206 [Variovorax boronicumulans]|uniref:hypothetical protein n=1 Tax=Variovorax boronicumulans TaxID=436515 RepID=UPI0027823438|nr:hypothetical protein [Variovorax boronicumulans]MDQ0052170.1 hypothetical protein [Variovorax boronicumulans]